MLKTIKIVVILAILVLLFFSPVVRAIDDIDRSDWLLLEEAGACPAKDLIKEPSVFTKSYNVVYQLVDEHEYLFAPISGAVAGQVCCGVWCAVVGGVLGTVDELLIYFKIADKHHLIWAVFGAATGQVIKPSMVTGIAGIAVGILLPTGALNDHGELIAPVISTIAGYLKLGLPGLIEGIAAGSSDEWIIYNGFTDKHYMTFCAVGMATSNLVGLFNPIVSDVIGILLGVIAAEYEEEIAATLMAFIKTTKNLYVIYGQFLPREQLDCHIEKHVLALVGSQFMMQYLTQKATVFKQNLNYNFERLDDPSGSAWRGFKSELINFAIFLFPYVIGQTVSDRVDNYFCKKLQYTVEDKVRSELFSGETALRLSYDPSTTVAIDNLREDVSTITGSGSELITSAVSASIDGVYGVGIIIMTSPTMFVYYSLYNQIQFFIANYLATQQRIYGEKIRVLDSKLVSIMKHDTENIRTITERGGIEATKIRLQELYEALRKHEASLELWSSADNLWRSISGIADSILNYYLISNEINSGKIPFEKRSKVQIASWQVSDLLSWPGYSAQFVAMIDQSLDRVAVLEKKIHALPKSTDQIDRKKKDGSSLVIKDLEVGVEDRVLVSVKDLKLEMGKVYAVTGETGCGKTSFLSKIRGIEENNIRGKGNIYYPYSKW